jgi:GT2 family glycosyltransferase
MPPNCPWDVQYHRQAKNLGMFRNFNDAIFSAKGEWVHILCEDDFVAPQFYTVMQQALAGQPDTAGAACCGYANLYEPSHFLDKRPLLMPTAGVLPKDSWNDCLRACNPLQIPAVVFRRSALRAVGGFRTDFPFVGDMELYQRLAKRYQWYYVPQYMSVFRMHEESQSSELGRQGRLEGDVARLQEMVESTLLKENR